MAWESAIKEIKRSNFYFAFQNDTAVPGTHAIVALMPLLPYPISIIWYRWHGGHCIDIVNMMTHAPLRRLGLAKYLRDRLIEYCPDLKEIYTQLGNELSTPWLKATGFKQRPTGWHYQVRRKK